LVSQKQIELTYSYLENKASLFILKLAYIVACLKIINKRFKRSKAVRNIAFIASQTLKVLLRHKTALIKTTFTKTTFSLISLISL
jgi:hypothetical protein